MQYSDWAWKKEGIKVSKLGFGTTRFNTDSLSSEKGIEESAELVRHAIDKGINYFDVAPTYANGYAESILGHALKDSAYRSATPIYIAAKTGLSIDRTSDDLRRRLEHSLHVLHRENVDFYYIWSVMNLEQYREVMTEGGLYEGALRAREEGLIKHLCISLHCGPDEALRIVEDNVFEGIMISCNAMNYLKWMPVVYAAKARNMGIVTMNSLAGGILPRYSNLFQDLDDSHDTAAIKGLRFIGAIPEIDVALSGMPTIEQIDENCKAFESEELVRVDTSFQIYTKEILCSGCNYCAACTVGIPISSCM